MALRGAEPIIIEDFNGFFQRGDPESCPPDHFSDCNNVQYSQSSVLTRDGINTFKAIANPLRMYTYVQQAIESLLILDNGGNIWHYIPATTTLYGPILTISGMTDFGFVAYNGRAYITPCDSQLGLINEYVYVYLGAGALARRAGGTAPSTTLAAADGAAGTVEAGYHVFGVAYETDTGFITQIAGFVALNAAGAKKVDISSIPVSADTFVTARRIVATKAIDPTLWTGDLTGYQFYFVPGGRIANNTATTLTVDFYDVELLTDASHLLDLFTNIPAGVGLTIYHNRLVVYATHTDVSLAYVSYPGEPEAVDQVSGILIAPLDGNYLTNAQEFRDVLYLFKSTRTIAYSDNGDVPSSWNPVIVDQGIGASVHGIATVLDSGGVNLDYLLVVDYSGIMMFNGSYIRPELSWKIRDYWFQLTRSNFLKIQLLNDSISQRLYATIPDNDGVNNTMLFCDYQNGLNAKDVRWAKWTFSLDVSTITLFDKTTLLIGAVDNA